MSNRSADGLPPSTGRQKVCDMQMMRRKMDNEPEIDCQVTLFVANARKVCKNCPHTRRWRPHPAAKPARSPGPAAPLCTGLACVLRAAGTRSRPPHSLRPGGPGASSYCKYLYLIDNYI
ncbi:unnamed protein product [Nyctereutes procyonoides]|uniref:(raccoon dog) hypothetical protein n=1 Tax=Nyctereutes procyonoides TaxID=34880 RepID=A0A811ZLS8_NYCPR|nr:unnamed protein product [Nyctereutes procyonoides]